MVTVQAAHNRLLQNQSALLNTSSIFGLLWVALMMCTGMVGLIGMHMIIDLFNTQPQTAISLFYANSLLVNGLGGGIELVGDLWVLLLSIVGIKQGIFSKWLHCLGIWVGTFGVLTVFHATPYLKEIFGLSQIVWFICLGVYLRRVE